MKPYYVHPDALWSVEREAFTKAYLARDADARIAELETAGREYVTSTDQLIEANHARIDELEALLREIADNGGDLLTEDLIQRIHKSLMGN